MAVVVLDMDTISFLPPAAAPAPSGVCIIMSVASSALYVYLLRAWLTCRSRTHTMVWLILFLNLSLIWPLTSDAWLILGSCTKDCPAALPGGSAPVVANLRHSMMVVLPQPLAPTITVSGLAKTIVAASSGPKERMPRMDSEVMDDMARRPSSCRGCRGPAGGQRVDEEQLHSFFPFFFFFSFFPPSLLLLRLALHCFPCIACGRALPHKLHKWTAWA